MNKRYLLFSLLFLSWCSSSFADTYPEVLFENSLMSKSYCYSGSSFEGNSWINNMNGHLPVSDSVYFTPGNALLLNYISGTQGKWQTEIDYSQPSGYLANGNDLLVFKLFVGSDTKINELPGLQILQGEHASQTINLEKYILNYQDNTWLSVEIPLKEIGSLDPDAAISGVSFLQLAADGKEHHLFIDQIECLPVKIPEMKLTGKAMLSTVVAYEKHVDITWLLPLTPSIRYIKIYRSEDNKNFVPVGIRPITYKKYTDVVSRADASYFYKIAWVDYKYRESPFSDVKEAKTKHADDEALLDMVEKAHIEYFTDQVEFNSGMHKVSPLVKDARISVKGTGLGLLTQLVGVERKFIPRSMFVERLNKVVKFLDKSSRYHGAYPEILDGRTGSPVAGDSCFVKVDIISTAYLMEALLAVRSYLKEDQPGEKELKNKITKLWEEVDWNAFVKNGGKHLYEGWSPACHFSNVLPLGGYNNSFIAYVLGMASPTHALPLSVYQEGYKQPLHYIGPAVGRFSFNKADTIIVEEDSRRHLAFGKTPFSRDSTAYGMQVSLGDTVESLTNYQEMFLAFDPRGKRDGVLDYHQNQINLINYAYRRALNKGEQFVSLTDIIWPFSGADSLKRKQFIPAAALASYPYTPAIAMDALKNYYRNLGSFLWTEYGFRDRFDLRNNWVSSEYEAINQAMVPIMLENARTGLVWKLFMEDPDILKITQTLFTP